VNVLHLQIKDILSDISHNEFIYSLLNDLVSSSDYIALNGRTINELERI
jgi:hypothetical protein